MSIKVAKTAGFCYGVKRAVDEVYKRVENGENIGILGELIHNRSVIDDLSAKGVVTYNDVSEACSDRTVIIRTHGVKKEVIDELTEKVVLHTYFNRDSRTLGVCQSQ